MTDAGFFRGTSADQDDRFADKQKKLLKELNFSPILNTKLNLSKIKLEPLKPWVEEKIKEILEKDDDLLFDSIQEYLRDKEPDGKGLLVFITGFVDKEKASKFVEELWTKLIDLQDNSNGVSPKATVAAPSPKNVDGVQKEKSPNNHDDGEQKQDSVAKDDQLATAGDIPLKRASRSRSRTPPPQSNSEQRSRSQSPRSPNKNSDQKAESGTSKKAGSKSPSGSRSRSRSASRSKSRSRSPKSGSRSRSHSRSGSRSRSRSSSVSPRRSRSPPYRGQRIRRSRSGSYRARSRSPRGRRGYGSRGAYRGIGYERRGRGPTGPPRRRVSPPWSRRRFSPRSPPPRRRRTPSPMSPRRRSRSPYYRRRSRSRSPTYGHMMARRSPRPHAFGAPDYGPRHMLQHRDIQRPLLTSRSPRVGPMDHRGYSDAPILPRHSPGNLMISRQHDLPPLSHGPPGPSKPYSPPSSSSGRKKHKKDKKHKKHKKSKRHRSETPEKKKKHKKHKKSKKHKS